MLKDADMKLISRVFKRKFDEYLDDLAEFMVNYKQVVNGRSAKIYECEFDIEDLAEEAFIYHLNRFAEQENVVREARKLLKEDEEIDEQGNF